MQGIYLTLERQAGGGNKLLRIRFNRNLYSKKDAEGWWSKSKQALAQTHNLTSGMVKLLNSKHVFKLLHFLALVLLQPAVTTAARQQSKVIATPYLHSQPLHHTTAAAAAAA